MQRPSEADFENTTIERLKLLGYKHDNGGIWRENSEFPLEAFVHPEHLRRHLAARYSYLPAAAIETALRIAAHLTCLTHYKVLIVR